MCIRDRRGADQVRRGNAVGGVEGGGRGPVHPPLRRRGRQHRKGDEASEGLWLRDHQRPRRHPGEIPRSRRHCVRAGAEGSLQETAEEALVRTRSPDFWSGLALAALGGYIVTTARGWEYLGQDGPGPGFFPLWYGIAMLALSLLLVVKSGGEAVSWKGAGRAFATWGAFAVSVVLLK